MTGSDGLRRLIAVSLDPSSIGRASHALEHERATAIYDLVEENSFGVPNCQGPFRLHLSVSENRLILDIRSAEGDEVAKHALSLTLFRRIVKDYHLVCDSYHEAIRSGSPSRIEAIDMGRRGLHDEGSQILRDRLDGKVEMDFDTARRLFTLLSVLHWRG